MDWANERYVRLYTRDSTTWKLLDWKARALLPLLMRKLNRAGVLEVGNDGVLGVAAQVEMPVDIVEDAMRQLLARGVFVMTKTAVVMPNFLEAQEASQTTAHRSREYRARLRDGALHDVTDCDAPITKRDADITDRGETVTARNEPSQRVTPSLAEPNQEEIGAPAKPPRAKPRKPRTAYPEAWAPSESHRAKAFAAGIDIDHEAQQFRTDSLAKGKTFVDWDQAFHTWLGNAIAWKRERRPSAQTEIRTNLQPM